jgi:formamidopyrimidine-DNA glycosylase
MPEAPEVYVVSRQMKTLLVGAMLERVEVLKASWAKSPKKKGFVEGLAKQLKEPLKLTDIKVRGKLMVLCFGKVYLAVHFMLAGHFYTTQDVNTRAVFHFKQNGVPTPIYFDDSIDFATFTWLDLWGLKKMLESIGPSIVNVSESDFIKRLEQHPKKIIAAALHNQSIVSGIGNYLRAEALYSAKIQPDAKIAVLDHDDLKRLYNKTVKITKAAIAAGGTEDYADIFHNYGGYKFKVYRKQKDPKGRTVQKMKIGSQHVYYTI